MLKVNAKKLINSDFFCLFMSESTDQSSANNSSQMTPSTPSPEQSLVEIDLNNLTDTQKLVLVSIPIALVVQIIYLFNMHLITDFFKGMIVGISYKPIADYVTSFLSTFVPYLVVIFLFFALYSVYLILVNDGEYLKLFNSVFFYLAIALVVDFILFYMSVSTQDAYTTEFFLFLFVIIVMGLIAWLPFFLYDVLEKRTNNSTSTS